ncbi:MAG: AMP-binding protein [Acidimicrobiales bacterium]
MAQAGGRLGDGATAGPRHHGGASTSSSCDPDRGDGAHGLPPPTACTTRPPARSACRCRGRLRDPARPGPRRPAAGTAAAPGEVGEVVYRGPNVMLGYAATPADLAAGAVVDELRTGDLGRLDPATGMLQLTGRRSRIVKPYGLRLDLDELEAELADDLGELALAGDDDGLVVACPGHARAAAASLVAVRTGLPATAVAAVAVDELPRTGSGKVDHARLLAVGRAAGGAAATRGDAADATDATDATDERPSSVLAHVLGLSAIAPDQSFVAAGGDSLSYVEATARLEAVLGRLPDDWHHVPVGELDRCAPRRPVAAIDATVLLRAIGICTVVATHMALVRWPGGAHLLLAVAGYNLSRFQLGLPRARDRLRSAGRTILRTAAPAAAVAAAVVLATDRYGWTTVAMVNNYLGPRTHRFGHWHLWFIEAFVQLVALTSLLLAIPAVRRIDRRLPYAFAVAMVAGALALREATWFGIDDPYNLRFRTHAVAVFFALGWLAQRSTGPARKVATTVVCLAVVPGTFGLPQREAYIVAGIVLIAWAPRVPFPRLAGRVVAAVAAASMWILITHFHVWPVADRHLPTAAAYPATLAVGVLAAGLASAGQRAAAGRLAALGRRHPRRAPAPHGAAARGAVAL